MQNLLFVSLRGALEKLARRKRIVNFRQLPSKLCLPITNRRGSSVNCCPRSNPAGPTPHARPEVVARSIPGRPAFRAEGFCLPGPNCRGDRPLVATRCSSPYEAALLPCPAHGRPRGGGGGAHRTCCDVPCPLPLTPVAPRRESAPQNTLHFWNAPSAAVGRCSPCRSGTGLQGPPPDRSTPCP